MLLRSQPVMELPKSTRPKLRAVTATTDPGSLPLDKFLFHPESYAQGFIVIHKGKVAYESYPGIHELGPHFTASVFKILRSMVVDLLIDDGLPDRWEAMCQNVLGRYGTTYPWLTHLV